MSGLQPGFEHFDVEAVLLGAGVVGPDIGHGDADPIVVTFQACVQAETFLFVVDGGLDEPLDNAASAAKI